MSLCAPVYQCILFSFLRLMLNYFKIVKWNYKNDKNVTPKLYRDFSQILWEWMLALLKLVF